MAAIDDGACEGVEHLGRDAKDQISKPVRLKVRRPLFPRNCLRPPPRNRLRLMAILTVKRATTAKKASTGSTIVSKHGKNSSV